MPVRIVDPERDGDDDGHETAVDDGIRYERGQRQDLARQFMDYDLGYFDDEECRLEPLANPFGRKVLPMSPV